MPEDSKPDSTAVIDDSSIAPSRPMSHHRQDSLAKHLQNRPDSKELKERNILLDTNAAPSIQATALELERQRASDALKRGLGKRPDREDLVERNILPTSTVHPSLIAPQKELEKHMRADSLNEKIAHRPSPEELLKRGVLDVDPTSATAVQGDDMSYEEKMEDEYAKREGGA